MTHSIDALLATMARLRDPETGCPWDIEQTFKSIAPHTIEEAYEVADAIQRDNLVDLKEELGDLLLQVVFHCQMADESGAFDFNQVAETLNEKLIRRHPHVFGDKSATTAGDVVDIWEDGKVQERAKKARAAGRPESVLDDVAHGLPALMRATKLQKRMARVGFEWTHAGKVIEKIEEELAELKAEIARHDASGIEEEFGDLLFTMVNLARWFKIDPEAALRATNYKVERRFHHVEKQAVEQARPLPALSLAEMETLWREAKQLEKSAG